MKLLTKGEVMALIQKSTLIAEVSAKDAVELAKTKSAKLLVFK